MRQFRNSGAVKVQILMVCLGNICRSPTAHGVMEKYIKDSGLSDYIEVDSAGTGSWNIGESPDSRAMAVAARRGYDISRQVARQVVKADFQKFDYILAMDRNNLKDLRSLCPQAQHSKLRLLLDYGDSQHESVPDPYHSDQDGFERVLDLVEVACQALLAAVSDAHGLHSEAMD